MSLAIVMSRALDGVEAPAVRVEVHLANGLPSFTLVGLADTEVKEARERVRAALAQCGFEFPHNRRVTVNLSPADLPKESGRFDLPIALGILAAAGAIAPERLEGMEFAGELSLDGALRPVRGALALALAARESARRLVLPAQSAQEAARVPALDVRSAATLLEVVQALVQRPVPGDESAAQSPSWKGLSLPRAQPHPPRTPAAGADLREVRGQTGARRALEIAAAGAHSLLMIGPPGSGKSMLAERLPSILPPMSEKEALQSAALLSLSSAGKRATFGQRPLRSPHHSASAVALVGGGSPPRPGEISLAHHGVLFLDELPEFSRHALEALREPLQAGRITISRAARQAVFPARFQLVAAMNPCPCGWRGAPPSLGRACRCTPDAAARYLERLSGPLLDRIDLVVEVAALPADALLSGPEGEASAVVRERVVAAWTRRRQRACASNSAVTARPEHHADGERELENARIDRPTWAHKDDPGHNDRPSSPDDLEPDARALLRRAAERLALSGRGVRRALNVARTIADLAASPTVGAEHVAEAIQYRRDLSDS